MRSLEYYNNMDFTNLEIVKKVFRENYIYTGKEFYEQNGYLISSRSFTLPDGQEVIVFRYEKNECVRYEEDDDKMSDE